jgi:enoyl reductase-like protein
VVPVHLREIASFHFILSLLAVHLNMSVIKTPITELFGIQHPIILAGMNVAAGPELAAAVTNAGGLGVIGGLGYTPKMLRGQVGIRCL